MSFLPFAGTVTEIDFSYERIVVSETRDPTTTHWWFGFVEVTAR